MNDQTMFRNVTFSLTLVALVVVLYYGLLPGVLAGFAAFAVTRLVSEAQPMKKLGGAARGAAAAVVIVIPLAVLTLGGVELAHFAADAAKGDGAQSASLVDVASEWRKQLPVALASHVPEDRAALAAWLEQKMGAYAPSLAGVGASWAHGLLIAVVGLVVGALAAMDVQAKSQGPLASDIRARAAVLYESFLQIVVAQFWIASINTVLTAAFIFAVLPLFEVQLPYAGWLVLLTFVAGMLPIVGNLLCNAVLTVVGLQVGPHVALACLGFLVAIHKLEFLINAKVVGTRIATPAWELVVAIFVFQAVFGVAGFVAAPLLFAYVKSEMKGFGWI